MSMSQQYSASEKSFNSILSSNNILFVPPFQRPYKWGEDEIEEFFDDVFKPIDWNMGMSFLSRNGESHYMGAVVLCKKEEGHMILDGQQRLTTITLILSHIKARLNSCANSEISKIRKVVGIESRLFRQIPGESDESMPIIRPQKEDDEIFSQILKSDNLEIPLEIDAPDISAGKRKLNRSLKRRPMFKAYETIKKFVQSYIIENALKSEIDEFSALDVASSRLLNSLSFVEIIAHNESAAFRLFETLNDRGLDLSAADLIKNNLFTIARDNQQRKLVEKKWEQLSDLIGSDLVSFLRTFWLMEHEFVRKDKLFDAYKAELTYRKNDPNFLSQFLDLLIKSADHYIEISQYQSDSSINKEVNMLNDLGAKTCRPMLLAVKLNYPHLFSQVAQIVESLTVRWMIAGKVFNVLETNYAKIAVLISESAKNKKDDSTIIDIIKSELKKLDVPDDELFRILFQKYEVPRTSRAVRHILCRINKKISETSENIADSSSVHIEHIFPQEPSFEALEQSEITDEETVDYSTNIGNITLLDAKVNMGLKNKAFLTKLNSERGYKISRLAINDTLKKKTSWKKADIEERAKYYANLAIEIWTWK